MTEAKIDVIPLLKKVLQRQYENGYDSACDALEEAIAELERLRAAVRDASKMLAEEDVLPSTYFAFWRDHADALRDAGVGE